MNDALLLAERVKNNLQLGESHFREFKSALEGRPESKRPRSVTRICQDIGEALVSFANADGGDLLIGVEDDSTVTGIPHSDEEIARMLDAVESHVFAGQKLPLLFATKLVIETSTLLFFSVAKSTVGVFQLTDGRCVRRRDKETIPIDINYIIFERAEQKSREFDRDFVDDAKVSDLDLDLLVELATTYLPGISIEKYLQQVGLAEYTPAGLRLRKAALILFAKRIEMWVPRSEIRVVRVLGTELQSAPRYNVSQDERFVGNAFKLLINGWDFLRPFLIGKTSFGHDATFENKYVYPEIACREALVNAIAHRDYTISNSIEFFLYDDRLTIKSPGQLLSTIRIDDLKAFRNVHESRNTLVARVLRESKYMREMGEGIKRIYDALNESEIGAPILNSIDNAFSLTIENKSIYTAKELEWLSLFDSYKLTKLQKRIVALGLFEREIAPSDIYSAIGTKDRNVYDSVVTSLRVIDILQETRTAQSATNMSKRTGVAKATIGRFRVAPPGRQQILYQTKVPNAIFVFNLPDGISRELLEQTFSKYGEISNLQYPTIHNTDRHFNYCFVHFREDLPAQELVRKKVILISGAEVNISEFIEKKNRSRQI